MYLEYYKLQSLPFRLSPDHRFFFDSEPHKEAAACLNDGMAEGRGFIVITGEVGAGKTTLVNRTLSNFRDKDIVTAKIVTPQLEGVELLRMVNSAFGLAPVEGGEAENLSQIESFLIDCRRADRRALLFIDEAQSLPDSALKELTVLSDFQLDGKPLLQIYLIGQPEFRKILSDRICDQLRQRVVSAYHLRPLDAAETESYVQHRLQQAGWQDDPHITEQAFRKIHDSTDGIPRRINLLCDRLFLYAYLGELHAIDGDVVMEVLADLRHEGLVKGLNAIDERPGEGQSESALSQLDAKGLAPGLEVPADVAEPAAAETEPAQHTSPATNGAQEPTRQEAATEEQEEAATEEQAEPPKVVAKLVTKHAPPTPELLLVDRIDDETPRAPVRSERLAAQRSNALASQHATPRRGLGGSGRALAYGAGLLLLVGAAGAVWQFHTSGEGETAVDSLAALSEGLKAVVGAAETPAGGADGGSMTKPEELVQAAPAAEPAENPYGTKFKPTITVPARATDNTEPTKDLGAPSEVAAAKPAALAQGAASWLRPAAEKGVASAQKTLGLMYLGGSGGVSQDYGEALKWLRKAAVQGEAWAQMGLGLMYENSKGVKQDYVEAHSWYSLAGAAMAPGDEMHKKAAEGLDRVSAKMTAEQVAVAERLARERIP